MIKEQRGTLGPILVNFVQRDKRLLRCFEVHREQERN